MDQKIVQSYYKAKRDKYYTGVRHDILEMLGDQTGLRILEIGCGDGANGEEALKRGIAETYCGVELMPVPAKVAESRIGSVIQGDIEALELPWAGSSFDVIIASEVLEHLRDPWSVVARLVRLLSPEGKVFASSPNIANQKVVRDLLRGRFELTDTGVMDRTHLRWFTPSTYSRMFEDVGMVIEHLGTVGEVKGRSAIAKRFLPRKYEYLFWSQIFVVAKRP